MNAKESRIGEIKIHVHIASYVFGMTAWEIQRRLVKPLNTTEKYIKKIISQCSLPLNNRYARTWYEKCESVSSFDTADICELFRIAPCVLVGYAVECDDDNLYVPKNHLVAAIRLHRQIEQFFPPSYINEVAKKIDYTNRFTRKTAVDLFPFSHNLEGNTLRQVANAAKDICRVGRDIS